MLQRMKAQSVRRSLGPTDGRGRCWRSAPCPVEVEVHSNSISAAIDIVACHHGTSHRCHKFWKLWQLVGLSSEGHFSYIAARCAMRLMFSIVPCSTWQHGQLEQQWEHSDGVGSSTWPPAANNPLSRRHWCHHQRTNDWLEARASTITLKNASAHQTKKASDTQSEKQP